MIKRYTGTQFAALTVAKRWTGSAWANLTIAKRWNGTAWENLLGGITPSPEGGKAVVYSFASKATYWGNGNRDNQYPAEIIQGSYNSSKSGMRRTLLFLPAISSNVRQNIKKAEIYLQRSATSHGTNTATVSLKYAAITSAPDTYSGSNLGNASDVSASFALGEGKWIALTADIVQRLKSNSALCLSLDTGTDYSLSKYARFGFATAKIRITYGCD